MAVELKSEGFTINLEITGWKPANNEELDSNWCNVNLQIKSEFMDYRINSEILLSYEVEEIIEELEKFLDNKEAENLSFTEPDLEIVFHAPMEGSIMNGFVELIVGFWHKDMLTANTLSLYLDKNGAKRLLTYLLTVTSLS